MTASVTAFVAFLAPVITVVDKVDKLRPFAPWWDWLTLGIAWWFPAVPFVAVVICYLFWAPYKYNREIEAKRGQERTAHAIENVSHTVKIAEFEKRLATKLEISCGMDIDGCSTPSDGSNLHYFKAKVENKSAVQGITGCSATLLGIERDGVMIPIYGARQLPFAPSHMPDAASKIILAGEHFFVDVIAVKFTSLGELLVLPEVGGHCAALKTSEHKLALEGPGDYFLTISISGDGIVKHPARLKFKWTGSCATSTIGMA